ncbi:MAG: hypothetical protein AAF215_24990 [Cyanobacteria bacterium P01_A01_bin.123]
MDTLYLTSIPIACELSPLEVLDPNANAMADTAILSATQPFAVQLSVTFQGTNAIALLALTPTIQAEFYAKPTTHSTTIPLGECQDITRIDQLDYPLTLNISAPLETGLTPGTVYRLGALIKIGSPDGPALICGVQETGMVQIYEAAAAAQISRKKRHSRRQ